MFKTGNLRAFGVRPNEMTRRGFVGGLAAAFGGLVLPADALGAGAANLKFGVVSDVHIGADRSGHKADTESRLEKALRWFDAQGVDAVMVPGDIAHSGKIGEIERFAAVWYRVFPNDRGADGRSVARLFVTGNHDLEAWWLKGDDAWRAANVFNFGENPQRVWQRLFHEDWQLVWKKTVKGYTFVGSQWPTKAAKPPVEEWFRAHADELKGPKPFFYVQHAHPKGTCGQNLISYDDGTSTRALSPFANAVAITGHSHQTLTDDSSVWQGAFTSVNAGCLRSGANDRWHSGYDSIFPHYSAKRKLNRMVPLDGTEGGCGLLVEVFDSHLVIRRRSFADDAALGDDWCVALPPTDGGPYDPKRQKAESVGPEFAPGARLEAVRCAVAPQEIAGPALAGKPCVWVKIPHPRTVRPGSRVYDFEVELRADGKGVLRRLVLANGFNVPEARADRMSSCLFGADEVPAAGEVTFAVTPRNAFGVAGRAAVVKL